MGRKTAPAANTASIYLQRDDCAYEAHRLIFDEPDPDGPTMATVLPLGMVKLKFSKTIYEKNCVPPLLTVSH